MSLVDQKHTTFHSESAAEVNVKISLCGRMTQKRIQ